MKNKLIVAAVALLAVPAMASKARLASLNNAAHLEDIQDVFKNASKLNSHGDWLTFEMGTTSTGAQPSSDTTAPQPQYPYAPATPNAEGGFARGMGDAKYGFYLGHHSSWVSDVRQPNTYVTGGTYLTDENPINLFYAAKAGDLNWGVGLNYASSDKKTTRSKQQATGLNAGVSANNWDAGLTVGLVNNYKVDDNPGTGADETVDFKGSTAFELTGTYTMGTLTFNGLVTMNGGKSDTTANAVDLTYSRYNVGVVNSHKADGADFFYGVNYDMYTFKNKTTDQKYEVTQLPVFAGIEADATSWMVLRASIAQNLILGTKKDSFTTSDDANTIPNNTVVAAGVGLKFQKLLLDGTLSKATGTAATGEINGNSLLANASLTYMF